MRTTLNIEHDVLQAVKELAEQEGTTIGRVISALARGRLTEPRRKTKPARPARGGVPCLASRGGIVTLDKVRELMEREGI